MKARVFLGSALILMAWVTTIFALEGAPFIEQLKFEPLRPMTGDTLKLAIKLGGQALRAEVIWSVDNVEVARSDFDGLSPDVEFKRKIKFGEKITAVATPFDGGGAAGAPKTKSVTVENAPPKISLEDQKIQGATYTAKIVAIDPEGGKLEYAVNQGPPGLTIDQSGNVSWKLSESVSGSSPVIIGVKDDKGSESSIHFSIGIRWQGGQKGSSK